MYVVGYASRGAVMCGEPVVGFLLCDKERLCGGGGYGYAVVWDYAGVAGLCVSRCGGMVALCGGCGTMVTV